MVHCIEPVSLVVPFKKREIHHPERGKHMRVTQSEPVAHLDAEHSEHGLCLAFRTAEDEHHVTWLCAGLFSDSLQLFRSIELVH